MMGIANLITKGADMPSDSSAADLPDAGLFATLLGGEVQQAEAPEISELVVLENANVQEPMTEPGDPVPGSPWSFSKRAIKTLAGLSDAETRSVPCWVLELPEALEAVPEKSLEDAELQLFVSPQTGPCSEETLLSSAAGSDIPEQATRQGSAAVALPAGAPGLSAPVLSKEWGAAQPTEVLVNPAPVVSQTTDLAAAPVRPVADLNGTASPADGSPVPGNQALPAGEKPAALAPGFGQVDQPVTDSAPVVKAAIVAAAADGLIATKEQPGKRPAIPILGKTAPPIEFDGKVPQDSAVRAGAPVSEGSRPGRMGSEPVPDGSPESVPVMDAAFGRRVAESIYRMETERKRSSRASIDPLEGRATAPETARAVPFAPAHHGAVATSGSESRAADLQKLIDTFDRHMLSMVQQGDKMTRVTLDSREMGRLTVVCHEESSGLKVEIHAQSSAVQAALQRHEAAVRQLLQSHGSTLGKFDVTCGDGRGSDPRRFGQGRGFFDEGSRGGIEPAYLTGNEIELSMAKAPSHAVSIFA
jgi:hypothetical protein